MSNNLRDTISRPHDSSSVFTAYPKELSSRGKRTRKILQAVTGFSFKRTNTKIFSLSHQRKKARVGVAKQHILRNPLFL